MVVNPVSGTGERVALDRVRSCRLCLDVHLTQLEKLNGNF
jgi:hypothetical protein